MKKILIGTAAALALAFAAAPAQAIPGASQYCTDNDDFGLSHGRCTELVTKIFDENANNDAPAACKLAEAFDPDGFAAIFKSRGACVSFLRAS